MSTTASITDYLTGHAPIERFWIFRADNVQPGLIHYADQRGKAWGLIDDNDDRVERSILFLVEQGCPVFDDIAVMDEYAGRFC